MGKARWNLAVALAIIGFASGLMVSPATAFPGDNGRVAHVAVKRSSSHIFTVRPDGTQVRRLTGPRAVAPAYSPDGRRILYVRYSTAGRARIWLMHRSGANKTRIGTGPGDSTQPVWSPDGSEFVFVKPTDGGDQLYVYTFATGQTRQLTIAEGNNGPYSSQPAWAPGGRRVVFVRASFVAAEFELVWDLYSVRPDGTGLKALTSTPNISESSPNWAPGGRRIVYARMTAGNYRNPSYSLGLDIIRGDGTNRVRFSRTGEEEPSWSPDGRFIVAIRPRFGSVDAPAYDKPGLWKFRLMKHGVGVRIRRGQLFSPDWGTRVSRSQ
jgi:Tol biopolymer transport system component